MNSIKKLGTRYSKVIQFGIIGVLAFFVDWFVMKFLMDRQTHFLVARLLSFLVAVSFTFVLNKYWTFKNSVATPILVQFLQFFAANSVGGFVNYVVSTSSYFFILNSNPRFIWLSLVFGSGAGFVFNFVMSNRFVFRNR